MGNFNYIKSSLIAIPVLLMLVVLFQDFVQQYHPGVAIFDWWSESESFVFRFGQFLVITTAAWFFMKLTFPKAHGFLANLRDYFDSFDNQTKVKSSLWIWTVLLISFIMLLTGCVPAMAATCSDDTRAKLVNQLNGQIGVREATNNNDGPEVEAYLAATGLGQGHPWCAAFVAWNLDKLDIDNPQSAWSPHYAKKADTKWTPKQGGADPEPGDVFTLWYSHLKRVGHVGFIKGSTDRYFITVEGNTNDDGSRVGVGVFSLKRDKRKIYKVTDYITNHCNHEPHNKNIVDPMDHSRDLGTDKLQGTEEIGRKGNQPRNSETGTGGNIEATHDHRECRQCSDQESACDYRPARQAAIGSGDIEKQPRQCESFDQGWRTDRAIGLWCIGKRNLCQGSADQTAAIQGNIQRNGQGIHQSQSSTMGMVGDACWPIGHSCMGDQIHLVYTKIHSTNLEITWHFHA